jgi:endoglucanase
VKPKYHDWLRQLTSLPTAAGREDHVIAWVERFVARRRNVKLSRDRFGNITLSRSGASGGRPIYFTAHMDHPAFVVRDVIGARQVTAAFRGGVAREYFKGTKVLLHHHDAKPQRGVVRDFVKLEDNVTDLGADDSEKLLDVRFDHDVASEPGDVITWDVGDARIDGDRLHAPACDDLAGLAAALAAFDALGQYPNVRVLLTRAEEVGFIGAIAACKAKSIPKNARLICLENSKSYAESPIGGGPIVRVGDYTSTFDPDLTYRVGRIAAGIAEADDAFRWQRKLMPGGTCEASAFLSYGYTATCLCLPLGNYHNMNERTGRIAAETISVSDFDGLVRLLVETGRRLDEPDKAPPLRQRLDGLFAQRRGVLGG